MREEWEKNGRRMGEEWEKNECERGGHLDLPLDVELLHDLAVALREAGVVEADAKGQRVPQRRVAHVLQHVLQLEVLHVEREQVRVSENECE